MSMIVASTPSRSSFARHPYRSIGGGYSLRGLRGTYLQRGGAIPPGTTVITMVTAQPDPVTGGTTHGSGPSIGEMGRPFGLAVMYARAPLFWLAILFGGGLAAGYATTRLFGRRR